MRAIVRIIDSISDWTGKIICWLCVVLVLVLIFEVTARYVFDAPTIWAYETGTMLGCTIVAMGWAYTHRHHGHVRVDLFYARLSPRGKATVDALCALLLLFPLLIILICSAADSVWFSLKMGETLAVGYWYPPAFPIRTVFFLGLSLFFIQGFAEFIRDLYLLIRNRPL